MEISVKLGTQYGNRVVLPVCEKANVFCAIAGTKTMTQPLIEQIKSLGYRVVVIPTEPKEL